MAKDIMILLTSIGLVISILFNLDARQHHIKDRQVLIAVTDLDRIYDQQIQVAQLRAKCLEVISETEISIKGAQSDLQKFLVGNDAEGFFAFKKMPKDIRQRWQILIDDDLAKTLSDTKEQRAFIEKNISPERASHNMVLFLENHNSYLNQRAKGLEELRSNMRYMISKYNS